MLPGVIAMQMVRDEVCQPLRRLVLLFNQAHITIQGLPNLKV